MIGRGKTAGVFLFETKTKSDPDERQLLRQLQFDLQTMLYLVALEEYRRQYATYASKNGKDLWLKTPLHGVRYNVIKRPRQYQGKKETRGEFLERLRQTVKKSPQDFFMRWTVTVTQEDIELFKRSFLYPVLDNLCDDYEWWLDCHNETNGVWDYLARSRKYPGHTKRHLRAPFGVYNPLLEGNSSELDEYLLSGSTVGLQKTDTLFRELEV